MFRIWTEKSSPGCALNLSAIAASLPVFTLMAEIVITERLLMDAGGWQAMKHARALVQMGRVIAVQYRPPVLQGSVRDGETEFRSGLKIRTRTDIENLCSCRQSRDYGAICAHSLALGLAWIAPKPATPPNKSGADGGPVPKPVARGPALVTEGDAPLIELHIVVPPNFLATWSRDQIMLGFEVVQAGRRILASALPASGRFRGSAEELRILEAGRDLAGGGLPGMLSVSRDQFLHLLARMASFPRVTLGRKDALEVSSEAVRPALNLRSEPDGASEVSVRLTEGELLVGRESAWSYHERRFAPVAPGLPKAYLPLLSEPIRMKPEQVAAFLARELPLLRIHFQVPDLIQTPHANLPGAPGRPEVVATLEGSLNYLTAKLQFLYGKRIVTFGVTSPGESVVYTTPEGNRSRNLPFEHSCADELRTAGFQGPDVKGDFILRTERMILSFFAQDLPRLEAKWKVSIGSRLHNVSRTLDRVTARLDVIGSGEDWFEFSFSLESVQGDRFSAAEVQRLLQSGQGSTRLKNGRTALFNREALEEIQAALTDCQPEQVQPGRYRIHRSQAAFLDATFRDLAGSRVSADAAWERWTAQQRQLVPLEPVDLGPLTPVLRDYQRYGVAWMNFIRRNELGGILADEMGLGKTLQTLAFLTTLPGPSLVVCPASLVFNWQREAQRFTPGLKVMAIEGPDRADKFGLIPRQDLVLTSYPLLRRDVERYRPFTFQAVILDEANHIKNPDTQNAQAALALRGRHRFVLTGTPVENSVRDLWSIMNFVLPGYLGSRDDFRERYELPLARGSHEEAARLAKRLRPVILRRLKQDVAQELPGKIEQVAFCELSGAQRELYEKLHRESRKKIERFGPKDRGQARMAMLTALLRLRQVCCDLRLLDNVAQPEARSAKVDLLIELLEEAIDGGHRVLVFSQFVAMLTLLRAELEHRHIPFCFLHGGTKDRAQEIDRFQDSNDCPVFLISLKAGGVGLNLSAADTVFHFDPWWNPAVEDQATDRAHRLGQKRVVTVYKLIVQDTVEEKILRLQQKKRAVIEATVESEEPLMSALSAEEIAELLS
ncbi:MAG: SNF2 helicase associated domain-containing protein [Verrucomicrobia bacterium]|nr:SNF2 helicase associated domain-containing protein [Verrucomicrobiota bacterium]